MVRRVLLLVTMMVLLLAAPAAAQSSYGDTLDEGQQRTEVVVTSAGQAQGAGSLARTGQDDIVPLVQGAIVLIGGGMLLILVARRRHAVRRATA